MAVKRKLIEVSLPLEAINRESAREKSIRHGHPSTLHLWWARRPLAAARAVLFAQLVDDPSSDDTLTEEQQRVERDRLHRMIEQLVVWENTRDEKLLKAAHQEILKSTNGNPPPILDPFAGGGTIPLEAQRLGLEAHASDLNPVAVLINKALIEIPPLFRDLPPVFPGLADTKSSWKGAEGLAADVRAYSALLSDRAREKIGHHYPKADLPDGTPADVVAWIWTRTMPCQNPGCGITMPLVRSWWLSKKKGQEAFVQHHVLDDPDEPSRRRVSFTISTNPAGPATAGTVDSGAKCVACGSTVSAAQLRAYAGRHGLSSQLMAIVATANRKRYFLPPNDVHAHAADVDRPSDAPMELVPTKNHDVDRLPMYGMPHWSDAFTSRQLLNLITHSDLIAEIQQQVLADAMSSAYSNTEDTSLSAGGKGTTAYSQAVATYLGFGVSRMADISNSLCRWENTKTQVRNLFGKQTIQMLWDYAETSPFGSAAGSYTVSVNSLAKAIIDTGGPAGSCAQRNAIEAPYSGFAVSTDPPYYNNINYAEISDFFYVWLRRTLRSIHPTLLATVLTPKAEELVANPDRHGGAARAREFFQDGFTTVFSEIRKDASSEVPMTVYYAYKQTETDQSGVASSGWETLLQGMIQSAWQITATWPLRSELSNRMVASGTNALASSIVLSLRPRPEDAPMVDRRGFIKALQAELPNALRKLQQGAVAPVDLPQAAIGPGMAVFSRYSGVIEPDGSKMTVRSALARINEILDEVLNDQESDLDPTSRFAIAWFKQHGYQSGPYGDADSLARARNTSVDVMDRDEILTSRAGKVQLLRPADLPASYDVTVDSHTSNWEAAHHIIRILESEGIAQAGVFLRQAKARPDAAVDPDQVKELGHLLYRVCEAQGWTKEAISFNTLVTSWPDIVAASRDHSLQSGPAQSVFDFTDEEN